MMAAFAWIASNWRTVIIGALLGWALWLRSDVADARRDLAAEQAAHRETVAGVRIATAQARIDDAQRVIAAAAANLRINEETSRAYQDRLADARARADALRLRLDAAARAGAGGGGSAPVPGAADAARGPDGATAAAGLPLTLAERLTATEQAIQLDALQQWVRAALAPPPDLAPPADPL